MFAGIETGGTKTVCAVGSDGRIEARAQFPTGTDPAALVVRCAEFFAQYQVTAAGLGTFGPCDTDPESPTYGQILATPKPGWPGADIRGLLEQSLNVPVSITTDAPGRLAAVVSIDGNRVLHEYLLADVRNSTVVELAMWSTTPPQVPWPSIPDSQVFDAMARPLCTAYIGSCR